MSENKHLKLIRFLGFAIPILLIVYVLSTGPVIVILAHYEGEPEYDRYLELTESYIAPLEWCVGNNDFFKNLINSYLEFCFFTFVPDSESNE